MANRKVFSTPDCIPPSQESGSNSLLTKTGSARKRILNSDFENGASSHSSCNDDVDMICNHMRQSKTPADLQTFDSVNKTYMCAIKSAEWLAVAYYDTEECQMFSMQDVLETPDYEYLRKAKIQINPDVIITSSKQDEKFLEVLRGEPEDGMCEGDSAVLVEILPSMAFGYCACKRRILNMVNLPGLSDDASDDERLIFFSSVLNFDHENMIKVTGALLKYIETKRVGVELEDSGTRVPVLAIKTFSLDDMVLIDSNSYGALQIFRKEVHPSVYKSGSRGGLKEGLSLYGIMNHAKSPAGSRLLRSWFLHPTTNIKVIQQRQKAISYFLAPKNLEGFLTLQDSLKHFKNVKKILSKMLCTGIKMIDWQNLYKTIYHAICIGDACSALKKDIYIIKKITQEFSEDLYKIANLISKIVCFEDSLSSGRFVVREGVDADLDEKKRTYNGLPDLMTQVAQEELNKLDESITECSVIYLPQLGYLLAIPLSPEMKEEEDFQINGLEFVFLSDNVVHYKSARVRELDSVLGDTQCEITDHETAIMHRLQAVVLENTTLLLTVLDLAAELDCLLALTIAAKEGNYVCPEVTSDYTIHITGGRHPLQELCVSQFVPNDITFDADHGRLKILTGPNASGKSVYLKQIGLIVFLAHIGSFVPAETTKIGLTDAIFTRIHSSETVSVPLSTFMIDINQMAKALSSSTTKSLVIVDEFGKGTAAIDGMSILCACINHWLAMEKKCPRVIISTHFLGVDRPDLLIESRLLQYQTMEVMQDEDDLVFLYRVTDGYTAFSYAKHVAMVAGVPDDIVKRGEEVTRLVLEKKQVTKLGSIGQQSEQERFNRIVEKFLELDFDKCDIYSFLKTFVIPVADGRL